MECLWENECLLGEKQYLKISALFWTPGKKLCLYGGAVLFALLSAVIFSLNLPGSIMVGAVSAGIAVLLFAASFLLPNWISRAAFCRLCGKNAQVQVTTVFTEQKGQSWYDQEKDRIEFSYCQVKRCRETTEWFLLELDDGSFVPLEKGGFSRGSQKEWKEWMQSRNPKIRWNWLILG